MIRHIRSDVLRILFVLSAVTPLVFVRAGHSSLLSRDSRDAAGSLENLPPAFTAALQGIRFIENRGQYDEAVLFCAPLARGQALFYHDRVEFRLRTSLRTPCQADVSSARLHPLSHERSHAPSPDASMDVAFTVRYPGSMGRGDPTGNGRRAEKVSCFLGGDPDTWRREVATFDTLVYHDLYDGIDLRFYDGAGKLKYDFIVRPGASYERIRMAYDGIDSLSLTDSGDMLLHIGQTRHIEEMPSVHQVSRGRTIARRAMFRLLSRRSAGYCIPDVDPSLSIVIDPVYSTLLGGNEAELVAGVRYVNDSIVVALLSTTSSDLTTDTRSWQRERRGPADAYIVSFNIVSRSILSSTYFGGSQKEAAIFLFPCAAGWLIAGTTESNDLPITQDAFQKTYRGEHDSFIAIFDSSLSALLFASYIGGSGLDIIEGACLDASGVLHMVGWTDSFLDFPRTSGAVQKTYAGGGDDSFYMKIRLANPAVLYSTFLGGYDLDEARDVCVDAHGNAIICGYTASPDFPVRGHALQSTLPCIESGFITRIDSAGTRIDYSSFFGGSMNTFLESVTATRDGGMVFLGQTYARDIATTPGVVQPRQGNADTTFYTFDFVLLAMDSTLEKTWCSYLGGSETEWAAAITSIGDDIAVCGYSNSEDYPCRHGLPCAFPSDYNVAFSLVDGSGAHMMVSTLWGGESYDVVHTLCTYDEKAVICGFTGSNDFPTSIQALKRDRTGVTDGFFLVLDMNELTAHADQETGFLPSTFVLSQNYPNPFTNAGTMIPYTAAAPGKVAFTVWDADGTMIDHAAWDVIPGNHVHRFNNTSLSPGVYYYRLEMNGRSVVKKMLKL